MHEIGLESSILKSVLDGLKTIELRLGKPNDLKIKAGDTINIREDTWNDGVRTKGTGYVAQIRITQVLYFESFEEALNAVDHIAAIPSAKEPGDAIAEYRKFYSAEDEEEYGVIAFMFELA